MVRRRLCRPRAIDYRTGLVSRRVVPYLATLVGIAVLTAAKLSYPPVGAQLPFLLYFAVVLAAAWYGGRRPAIFAIAVCASVANYFFLGSHRSLDVGWVPLSQTGVFVLEGVSMMLLVALIRTARARTSAVGAHVSGLQKLTTALAGARTPMDVATVVVAHGVEALGAVTGTMLRITDDGDLEPIGATSKDAALEDAGAAASRSGRLELTATSIALPLALGGRKLGAVAFRIQQRRSFDAMERSLLETISEQVSQSLDRARSFERETSARVAAEEARAELERDQARREIVTVAGSAMAASLDYKTTLRRLAALLVPKLADWCAVEMIDEETGGSEQLTVAHSDPAKAEAAWEIRRRFPPNRDAPAGVQHVLRTGQAEMYAEITDEMLVFGAIDEEHLRISRALDLRSALIVPLVARGQTLGAITLVHAEAGRYTEVELALVEEIARRAAINVDNARLYGAEQHARAAADAANRLKDEFLATVSHELRTPLNAILGWSRMITAGALDEAKQRRAHETIERNATAMTQLIEDLLDVSRIISGKMRLEIESVDLEKVVDAAIESIRPAALAKEIGVRAIVEPSTGPILGDPSRLQQVVWNLLSNAVKFTPKGGKVEVLVRRDGSSVELCVSDNGPGIDPAFAPYVFDRFRQADGRITRSHGGLGLGLAIARQLVELHGGSVHARSEGLGRGATFTVKLPISVMRPVGATKPAVAAAPTSLEEGPPPLRGLRILAVDDDDDSRRLVQTVLERAGAQVITAASADEAMAVFDREVPDVVLSDIGMPGADGVELIRRIRALSPERGGKVPAAALTAYARASERTRVLTAGYLMHLAKPVEPDELLAVVASLARFATA